MTLLRPRQMMRAEAVEEPGNSDVDLACLLMAAETCKRARLAYEDCETGRLEERVLMRVRSGELEALLYFLSLPSSSSSSLLSSLTFLLRPKLVTHPLPVPARVAGPPSSPCSSPSPSS